MTKPTKPMISIPEAFAIDGIKADFVEDKIQNGFDNINPDVLAGDNLNKFIDDTYKGLNYSIKGVSDLYTSWAMYDENETYSNKSIVYDFDEDNSLVLYRSLQNSNTGHATSETDWWEHLEFLNVSDKAEITSWSFPSNKCVNLTLGTSGSLYTAPADGWFTLDIKNSANGWLNMQNGTNLYGVNNSQAISGTLRCLLPIKKGDSVYISYLNVSTVYGFRFIYAEGSI